MGVLNHDEIVMLSIIMPVFNAIKYIKQSIDSVYNQSISNFELICVDDGSQDGSAEFLSAESKKRDNLIFLFQDHQGSGVARNYGIEVARGKYIAFLDADDMYYDSSALELMVNVCEKQSVKVCAGYRKEIHGNEIRDGHFFEEYVLRGENGELVKFELFQNDFDFQNFVFERCFLIENNLIFPDYLRYQDPPFLLSALDLCGEFWLVPNYVYCYRVGQASHEKMMKNINYVLRGIRDELKIAILKNYKKLYTRIIDRLNVDYLKYIIEGMTEEVERLLNEINCLNESYHNKEYIKACDSIHKLKILRQLWGSALAEQEIISTENACFSIYRHMALLASYGKNIGDILADFGVSNIGIYGYGEIGQIVAREVVSKVSINHIYDANKASVSTEYGIIESPQDIDLNDDEIILITPGNAVQSISFELIMKGIERKRLVAIDTLLTMYESNSDTTINLRNTKQFLITGAQFHNKGAQAMLFVAVSELKERFPDSVIWYLPVDDPAYYTTDLKDKYKFLFLTDGYQLKSQLFAVANGLDAIIDVSGYALSSYWKNEWYINNLRIAHNYKIPIYLMPQSFGPFDFDYYQNAELKHLLEWAEVIFAREKNGYELLTKKYGLKNVKMSRDLVLQNKYITLQHIYKYSSRDIIRNEIPPKSVAVIPNIRICEFTSFEYAVDIYMKIIAKVLELGRNVYIIPHSDDESLCLDLKKFFLGNNNVQIMLTDMDCIKFKDYIAGFDYVIASRFHSIVHAFKVNVPCVVLGWADKYKTLMYDLRQDDVCLHYSDDEEHILECIQLMDSSFRDRVEQIHNCMVMMEKDNCFDCIGGTYE